MNYILYIILSSFAVNHASFVADLLNLIPETLSYPEETVYGEDGFPVYAINVMNNVTYHLKDAKISDKTLSSRYIVFAHVKTEETMQIWCIFSILKNKQNILNLCFSPSGNGITKITLTSGDDEFRFHLRVNIKDKWTKIMIDINGNEGKLQVNCDTPTIAQISKTPPDIKLKEDMELMIANVVGTQTDFQVFIQSISLYPSANENTITDICPDEDRNINDITDDEYDYEDYNGKNLGIGDDSLKAAKDDLAIVDKTSKTAKDDACKCTNETLTSFIKSRPDLIGPRGDQGPTGLTGKDGEPGEKGAMGPKGEPGKDGTPGTRGPEGPRGPPGPITEISGEGGPMGPPGTPGKIGEPGQDGEKGDPGIQGPPGKPGPPGKLGSRGETGERGIPGKDGVPGTPGSHGKHGEKGKRGEKGSPGAPGLPASLTSILSDDMSPKIKKHVIKTQRGFKGEPGEKGSRGEVGPIGPQGPAGKNGEDGQNGEPGKDGQRGEPGPEGKSGKKGERGEPGPVEKISSSTLASLKGIKGDKGDQGLKGVSGLKGDKGNKGDIGPNGVKGDKGEMGHSGPMGPIGAPGFNGTIGEKGQKGESASVTDLEKLKGEKGDIGKAGKDGMPGKQGPRGLNGPRGPPGPQGRQGTLGPKGEIGLPGISVMGQKGEKGDSYFRDFGNISVDPNDEDAFYPVNTFVYATFTGLMKIENSMPIGTLVYVIKEKILVIKVNQNDWNDVMMSSLRNARASPTLNQESSSSRPMTTPWAYSPSTPKYAKPETVRDMSPYKDSVPAPSSTSTSTARPYSPTTPKHAIAKPTTYPEKIYYSQHIRMIALDEPHTGNIHRRKEGADYECYENSRHRGFFKAFRAKSIEYLRFLIEEKYWHLPVVNIYNKTLFDSWESMFDGFGARIDIERIKTHDHNSIYSFNNRNVLIDNKWPEKKIWHGARSNGNYNSQYNCREWTSNSTNEYGAGSSLTDEKLLDENIFPCDMKLIVLCVEVPEQLIRKKNYSHNRHGRRVRHNHY